MVFDANHNKYLSFIKIKKIRFARKEIKILQNKIYQPDLVITSGSYILINNLKNISYMDKNLFINYIDVE